MSMIGKDKLFHSLKSILKSSNAADAAENAVNFLFPSVGSSEYRAARTLAPKPSIRPLTNKNYAYNYFRLTPSEDSWGTSEIDDLFYVDPSNAIQSAIDRMKKASPKSEAVLRSSFLELLADKFNEDGNFTAEWLVALAAASSYFYSYSDNEPRLLWEVNNSFRMSVILTNGLRRLSMEERANIFRVAVENSEELSLLCSILRSAVGDLVEGGSDKQREDIGFGDRNSEIRSLLSDKVRHLLETQQIWNQADPSAVFWFAWGSGLGEVVMQCTGAAILDKRFRKAVFELPISQVTSSNGNYKRVSQSWQGIVDLKLVEAEAKKEVEAGSEPDIKEAAAQFLSALERERRDPF